MSVDRVPERAGAGRESPPFTRFRAAPRRQDGANIPHELREHPTGALKGASFDDTFDA
jgi:hypothetical protein